MVALGEQLPFAWRELKQLQRCRLAVLDMSEGVVHPVQQVPHRGWLEPLTNELGPAVFTMRPATEADTSAVASMITARCDWMEERGLESWRENIDDLAGQAAAGFM